MKGELVLLYDIQFVKHPGKFRQHWLVPYMVKEITDGGAIQLVTLCGDMVPGYVNGSQIKPYRMLAFGVQTQVRTLRFANKPPVLLALSVVTYFCRSKSHPK